MLNPHAGLAAFLPVRARALGQDEEFSATHVYYALLVNLQRDRDATGALSVFATVGGTSCSWTAYAHKLEHEWRLGGTSSKATRAQLTALVRVLRVFGDGRILGIGDPLPAPAGERSASAFIASVDVEPPEPDAGASAPADAPTAILIDLTAPEVPVVDAKARRDEADPTPCKKTKSEDA